jgi:hypothetical protein
MKGWSVEDHQTHPKNEAPRAEWLSMEASEVTLRIRSFSGFGIYTSDKPFQRISIVAKDRAVADSSPGLSKMFYYRDRRNFPALLNSLQTFPETFEKIEVKNRLGQAQVIASSLDTETAVALAECQLRMASPKELPAAISNLIETYYTSGRFVELEKMAKQRENYVPVMTVPFPPEVADAYQLTAGEDVKTLWRNHQTALAKGEVQRASTLLEQFKQAPTEGLPKKEAATVKKVVSIAENRMKRFREGLLGGLEEGTKEQVLNQFDYVDFLLSTLGMPKVAAWATLTEDQLLDLVMKTAENKGRQHVQTTDLALYLIEQRGYDGVEIDIGTLLWGGISVQESYGGLRSIPMFILTQKTGVLNRGETHSQQTLSDQFAVEAGIYALQRMQKELTVRKQPEIKRLMLDLTEHAYHLSAQAPKQSKAYGYHSMAASSYTTAMKNYDDKKKVEMLYRRIFEESPSASVRQDACLILGLIHQHTHKDLDGAWDYFERVAKNEFGLSNRWIGFSKLKRVAVKAGREEEFLALANQALLDKDLSDQNPEVITSLIKELDK